MLWGITPALNLIEEITPQHPDLPDIINILLVGSTDARHILKTLARRYRHKHTKLNFYVMEACPETIAKQLLLLNIAFRPSDQLGLIQKTRTFMELYGNTLVRPSVAKHLQSIAQELIRMITDLEYLSRVMPFINVKLKFKERDYIENLFKFWAGSDQFDIIQAWDRRLRQNLGVRYDTRMAKFDWDLHMRYHSIGGEHICGQEYKSFRLNGVAFTWLESEVAKTNRSLVTGILANGEKFAHYGYLGDMVTGPFVTYGIDCEDKRFLKKVNNVNAHRSTDIVERNLRQIFHELEHQTEYEHVTTNDITLGHIVTKLTEVNVVETSSCGDGDLNRRKLYDCVEIDGVSIQFVTLKNLEMWKHKSEFKDFFHLIYFGSTYVKYMDVEVLKTIAKDKTKLLVENQLFVVTHRDEDLKEFSNVLEEKIKDLNKTSCGFDFKSDCYVKYIINS